MLPGMSRLMIPPAKLEHFIMVNRVKSDRRELDVGQAVRAAIGSTATRDEMLSVASRLVALTKILSNPDLKPWISKWGGDHASVNIAILKAAARAPLAQPEKYVNDLAFDVEGFKDILSEESPPEDGSLNN